MELVHRTERPPLAIVQPGVTARQHLARVERLNWLGDPSPKGLQQSYGLMVNYLYDLKRLDRNRAQLVDGKIAVAGAIEELQF